MTSAPRAAVAVALGCVLAAAISGAPAQAVADFTGTLTVGAGATTATTATAGQNASLSVAATAGQRLTLQFSSMTYRSCVFVTVRKPDTTVLRAASAVCGTTLFEPTAVPSNGTYKVDVDPVGNATGSVAVTAYNTPADATASLTVGGAAVAVATTVPAQNSRLTFTGTAAQRISLTVTGFAYNGCVRVSVLNPDTTTNGTIAAVCGAGMLEPVTLSASGAHTVVVDGAGSATGSVTVRALVLPANVTGTLTPGAAPATVTTTTAGQDASLTFAGTAGQRLSVSYTANTFSKSCLDATVRNPDGTSLIATTGICGADRFFEPVTLAATGTYTLALNPRGESVGSVAVAVYVLPADASAALATTGTPATVTTTAPGQNAKLTFSGTAGQRVSVLLAGSTFPGCLATRIDNPNLSVLRPSANLCGSTAFVEPVTLTATGTHTIVLDAPGKGTGSVTVRAYVVPADAAASLTLGAASVITTGVPGQNARLTFGGTANQIVTITFAGATTGLTTATVRRPDNAVLALKTVSVSGLISKLKLPSTGSYSITLDPKAEATGAVTVAVKAP